MISINIYIYKNRIKYTNEKPYDITIIEIKPNDNVSEDSFLELDDNIFDKNKMMSYLQTSVYLLHYPNGNNVEYSTGKIKNISLDKYEIEHYCETLEGSSGSPIFKLTNFKVIGVHKGSKPSNCNAGTFLKGPIEDFYLKNKERNEILDEKPIIKVNERNIGQYNEIPKITTNQIKLILHQMKNCICRIFKEESGYGTGFLCYFPFPEIDSKFPTLITNNHVLDEKEMSSGQIISFSLGDDDTIYSITIDKSRITYTNRELDVTIMEIKPEDNIKSKDFLEVDKNLFSIKNGYELEKIPIYIMGYGGDKEVGYSIGVIKHVLDLKQINYFCSTNLGSSGSPIMNLSNYKIIGIHCGANKREKIGMLFKKIIDHFTNVFILYKIKNKKF